MSGPDCKDCNMNQLCRILEDMDYSMRKGVVIIEDDYATRNELISNFKNAENPMFKMLAAPTLEDAVVIINKIGHMDYAIIDDIFPRKRNDAPERLSDELYSKIHEKFPDAKVFAYAESSAGLKAEYASIISKKECTPAQACDIIVAYAALKET